MKENLFASVGMLGTVSEQLEKLYEGKDMLNAEDVEALCLYIQLYKTTVQAQLNEAEEMLASVKSLLEQQGKDAEKDEQYLALMAQRDALKKAVEAIDEFLNSGKAQLVFSIETILEQQAQLEASKLLLEDSKAQLAQQTQQAQKEFATAEDELSKAQSEYEAGVLALESTKASAVKELISAKEELDLKKEEAQAEFLKAEAELSKAQADLDALQEPQWMCNTRGNNPGYSTYEDNVERITAVGKVFPVFFLLVAVLVCVTTMSMANFSLISCKRTSS